MVRVRVLCVLAVLALTTAVFADKEKDITLSWLGTYASGVFTGADDNPDELPGSEIAAYDPETKHLFITNVFEGTLDIVNIADPSAPQFVKAVDLTPYGAFANSVAVHKGIVAVAVQADDKTDDGQAVFFDANGKFLAAVTVGALPDMLTFTPDGKVVLVANEGEPNSYGQSDSVDPEGSVSIIRLPRNIANLSDADVTTAGFHAFNVGLSDSSIRIFGPGASVSQDLEPEYIAVSDDSKTAWVTLQENNAIAELDIANGIFVSVVGLGYKDHSVAGFGLDGSDQDGPGTGGSSRLFNVAQWRVQGMYLPDAIATYRIKGQTYLLTANEGDVREWDGMPAENARISSFFTTPGLAPGLCPTCNDDIGGIGRLNVSRIGANATSSFSSVIQRLFSYGARSFSIWTTDGVQVFDSGDQFEQLTQGMPRFNSTHDDNTSFDERSDDKGPEPEGITVSHLWGRWYAFIALERIGGIMVYDVTDPADARFVQYINRRNFNGSPEVGTAGDLGAEASFVIPITDSPTRDPLLVVPNEVSGTTSVFKIAKLK